jgi:competence protein ComEC
VQLAALAFLGGALILHQCPVLPGPLPQAALLVLTIAAGVWRPTRLLAWVLAGVLWSAWRADPIIAGRLPAALEGETLTVEGVVDGLPRVQAHVVQFPFIIQQLVTPAGPNSDRLPTRRVQLGWYQGAPALQPGQRWQLQLRLKRPHGFMNPGGFDYEAWLFQQKIQATGYVRNSPENRQIEPARGYPVQRLRQLIANTLADRLAGRPQAGVVTALAIGETDDLTPEQWRVFSRTGTVHLVAISGQHIALVAALAFAIGRWLWSRSARAVQWLAAPRFAALCAIAAALAYALLAGFSVPTQRALIMVAVMLLGSFGGWRLFSSQALALAALAVLIADPAAVLAPGFWLSFGTVGLILFTMQNRTGATGWWWRWGRLHGVIALGLLPLLFLFFGNNLLTSPLANFIAVPWFDLVVVPLILLSLVLLPLLPDLAQLGLYGAATALNWLWPLLHSLSDLDLAVWSRPPPPPWAVALGLIGIAVVLLPRGISRRWLGGLMLLPIAFNQPLRLAAGEWQFTLLDIGQGLSAVVHTREHALVFDTGPRYGEHFEAGAGVIAPYLRSQGVRAIDAVIVSHGDQDHAGGLPGLARELPVRRLLLGDPRSGEDLPKTAPAAELCQEGQTWEWDGVQFEFLNPPPDGHYGKENDNSCVLRISGAGASVLIPGDIELAAEQRLVRDYHDELASQVLVAPHHGSRSSSSPAFLNAVAPKYALFSVGYRNRFHFPAARVVARYREHGTLGLSTAGLGALSLRFRSDQMELECFRATHPRFWREAAPAEGSAVCL